MRGLSPKFYSPSNFIAGRWWFEPHCLPIRGLNILKMIDIVILVISVLPDLIPEHAHGVPDEEVSHVLGHQLVHSPLDQFVVDVLVIEDVYVVVSLPLFSATREVAVDAIVPGLWDLELICC